MTDALHDRIRDGYSGVAAGTLSGSRDDVRKVAEAFGYTADELARIPEGANMALSCGNPTAHAGLQPGETVVDLGCGGGIDVFLAADRVGPTGRVIGIDMTPEMIARAKANAAFGPDGRPYTNVEFHLAEIESLPLPDASVDLVISNCVINLVPDKPRAFAEIARVLRPGGRVAISDIALKQTLPEDLKESVAAWVGCVAGAILIDEYRDGLVEAGLSAVEVVPVGADLNAYATVDGQVGCCSPGESCGGSEDAGTATAVSDLVVLAATDARATEASEPSYHASLADVIARYDLNDYAVSVRIYAVKD